MRGSASMGYSFDDKTKSVTSWKMTWLNQPLEGVFLNGIFDKTG
jgi:hypothetical protein